MNFSNGISVKGTNKFMVLNFSYNLDSAVEQVASFVCTYEHGEVIAQKIMEIVNAAQLRRSVVPDNDTVGTE